MTQRFDLPIIAISDSIFEPPKLQVQKGGGEAPNHYPPSYAPDSRSLNHIQVLFDRESKAGSWTERRVHLKYAWRDLGTNKSHHSTENLFRVLFVWKFQSFSDRTGQIFWFTKVQHRDDSQGECIFKNHHRSCFFFLLLRGLIYYRLICVFKQQRLLIFHCGGLYFYNLGLDWSQWLAFDLYQGWRLWNCFIYNRMPDKVT